MHQSAGLGFFSRGCKAMLRIAVGSIGFVAIAIALDSPTTELLEQKLDRIDVFSTSTAQGLLPEPIPYGVIQTGITACQNTAAEGLYCLVNGTVRRWINPEAISTGSPDFSEPLFSCSNPDLGLDKGGLCTAMTVDRAGAIWIAGKRKSAFSLIKVVKKVAVTGGTACPTDDTDPPGAPLFTALRDTQYCAREYAAGRPVLVDLSVVNEDVAPFPYGTGVLGLENRNTAVFFKDEILQQPITLGSGAKLWGLSQEDLQGITLLQRTDLAEAQNWILVTTSKGRLLSKRVSYDGTATPVFPANVSLAVTDANSTCTQPLQAALFQVRTSTKSGDVYATDRRGCRALALTPSYTSATSAPSFSAPEIVATALPAPAGLSVAPGIDVDLRKCAFGQICPLIPDTVSPEEPNTFAAAELTGVQLDGTAYGMILFQVRNIPDCRHIPPADRPNICNQPGIIEGPADKPEQQYLNVALLMPDEITDLYAAPLPPMWLSPEYSARPELGYVFDGLFGKTEDEVQFRNSFTATFDVGDLLGPDRPKLGCGGAFIGDTNVLAPQPNTDWDVLVTISERYTSVGGPSLTPNHADMLINADPCTNPAAGNGGRFSIYAYGLRLTPTKTVAGSTTLGYPDSVFAALTTSLATDLGDTLTQYVCTNAVADGGTGTAVGAPVSSGTCSSLQSSWDNTADKLSKCILASTDPKNSAGAQTCQAFRSQFDSFSATVDATVRSGIDRANRIGELKARKNVLFHVFDKHFYPSIPENGFNDM